LGEPAISVATGRRSSKGAETHAGASSGPPLRGGADGRGRDTRRASYAVLDRVAGAREGDQRIAGIVRRVQAGDDLAFAELYVMLFDRVRRYLTIALKNEEDAQEVAQDVFAKLLTAIERFDARRGEFRPWLFAMVRRMALDHLRRARRADAMASEVVTRFAPNAAAALRERFDPTADLAAIVNALPAAQRRVVVLRFAFDFTPTEIADVVGTTADAIRHTQHRALKSIASALAREGRVAAESAA
jgi:RNA polymerase sigma-70 factor (ECF subfamily)